MVIGATALSRSHFGEGVGPILLDELRCRGDEERLLDCNSNVIGDNDCSHSEDAAVTCIPSSKGSYLSDL